MSLATRRPDTVVQTSRLVLEKYALSQYASRNVLQRLELVWNDDICQLVLDRLGNPDTGLSLMSWCIEVLCAKGIQRAREIALAIVRDAVDEASSPEVTEKGIVAAQNLAQACPDWWSLLWESLSKNVSLAKGFIQRTAGSYFGHTSAAAETLSEDQIATLYICIADNFPEISEPINLGGHFVSPAEQIQDLANALLTRLQKRATFGSVEALRRIRDQYTQRSWLRRAVAECEDEYYAATWSPPSVDELTVLIDQPATRYVSDEHDLLTVLEEQLDVLQQRLRGETPACWELWNEWKQSRVTLWGPREETLVSDWVKDRLDLIFSGSHVVINHEVEIRRGVGPAAPGQNPDVHVVATRDTAPNVEVIIEVMGCWNADLLTGMRKQLAHRYLADNACHTGIYLVAWSNWSKWDKGDTRRGRAFRHNRSQLEALLSHQAVELGVEGYTVVARLLDLTPPNALLGGD